MRTRAWLKCPQRRRKGDCIGGRRPGVVERWLLEGRRPLDTPHHRLAGRWPRDTPARASCSIAAVAAC
eukprot:1968801-Alexandrium_andersonii.AAC.1